VTAVSASTPPADAFAPTERHHRLRERGVLSLAAIAAVALIWLSLDAPGVKLVMPGRARDGTETPVIANLALEHRGADARRPVSTSAATRRVHARKRHRHLTGAGTIVVSAPRTGTAAAPEPPVEAVAPTSQPPQISATPAAQPAPPPPVSATPPGTPASVPVEPLPAMSEVVTTAVTDVTAAVPPGSGVTDSTQQATSSLSTALGQHPG